MSTFSVLTLKNVILCRQHKFIYVAEKRKTDITFAILLEYMFVYMHNIFKFTFINILLYQL